MMTTDLSIDVFTYSLLHKVNTNLMEWNLEPLIGKALYSKHDSIAYLELKMYSSKQGDFPKSQIIWNIPDYSIDMAPLNHKSDIEKSLIYFLRYIAALRGENIYLTFEINDIAFDMTATRHNPFEKAVIYALICCFDKEILPFSEERIKTLKENSKH